MNLKIYSIIIVLVLFASQSMYGQTADEILQSVMQNNLTIKAIHEGAKAGKLENTVGITLSDPEVDFSYQWGAPTDVLNKVDLDIKQSFDYATVFGLKRRLAKSRNELVDIKTQEQELSVILQAKELLVNIVCANKIKQQYEERESKLKQLIDKYNQALKAGNVTKLDVNKMRLSLAEIQAEANMQDVERQSLLLALKALNGGKEVMFNDINYPTFAHMQGDGLNASSILSAKKSAEDAIALNEIRRAKAESLPELSLGYVAELTKTEKLRGIGIGFSIPLWSNRNNVHRAKAIQVAQTAEYDNALHQLNAQREEQTARVSALQKAMQNAYNMLKESNSESLLQRALHLGEISVLDYLLSVQDYYSLSMKAIEIEHEYQLALVRLSAM